MNRKQVAELQKARKHIKQARTILIVLQGDKAVSKRYADMMQKAEEQLLDILIANLNVIEHDAIHEMTDN